MAMKTHRLMDTFDGKSNPLSTIDAQSTFGFEDFPED